MTFSPPLKEGAVLLYISLTVVPGTALAKHGCSLFLSSVSLLPSLDPALGRGCTRVLVEGLLKGGEEEGTITGATRVQDTGHSASF